MNGGRETEAHINFEAAVALVTLLRIHRLQVSGAVIEYRHSGPRKRLLPSRGVRDVVEDPHARRTYHLETIQSQQDRATLVPGITKRDGQTVQT